MPIYTTTFPQDFWKHNFQQGGHGPPRPPYNHLCLKCYNCMPQTFCGSDEKKADELSTCCLSLKLQK